MRSSLLDSLLLLSAVSFAIAGPANDPHSGDLSKCQGGKVAAAYYPQWHAEYVPLENLAWHKYTDVIYAFINSTADPSKTTILPEADAKLIPKFVDMAHKHGVRAHVGHGGWSESRYFSSNVGDEKNRAVLADTIVRFLDKYGFDGYNTDWEYPNSLGIGCNAVSPNDTANFLTFLQLLKKKLGKSKTQKFITAAVPIRTFLDAEQKPSLDVSGFGDVLDWATLMVYDVWGNWSPRVGSNGPLRDSCAPKEYQMGSAESAVKAWTDAGFPQSKLVLGLATYGHSFNVSRDDAFNGTKLAEYPPFDAKNRPQGDEWSDPARRNVCGDLDPVGDTWNFWALIKHGLLKENGQPSVGTPYRFDNCSQSAYVYRNMTATRGVMISYDSPESYVAKGTFIKENSLAGFTMWEAGGDYHNILLDSVRKGAGL